MVISISPFLYGGDRAYLSHRFNTTQAVWSPVTLIAIRNIPKIRSTPIMIMIPSVGIPADCNTEDKMIVPHPGIPGVPMDAATIVNITKTMFIKGRSIPFFSAAPYHLM